MATAEVQRARAVGVIVERLKRGAWSKADDATRRETASALLKVRLRVNRAGLLRWRRIERSAT